MPQSVPWLEAVPQDTSLLERRQRLPERLTVGAQGVDDCAPWVLSRGHAQAAYVVPGRGLRLQDCDQLLLSRRIQWRRIGMDGTGIPLDDGMLLASQDLRAAMGIDEFSGAGNSGPVALDTVDDHDVEALFR